MIFETEVEQILEACRQLLDTITLFAKPMPSVCCKTQSRLTLDIKTNGKNPITLHHVAA